MTNPKPIKKPLTCWMIKELGTLLFWTANEKRILAVQEYDKYASQFAKYQDRKRSEVRAVKVRLEEVK